MYLGMDKWGFDGRGGRGSIETIGKDGNCYIESFVHLLHLRPFRIICGCALVQGREVECMVVMSK
jgi:hypothetical protein